MLQNARVTVSTVFELLRTNQQWTEGGGGIKTISPHPDSSRLGLIKLASYEDKILAQLTISTFSRKRHLEISVLKSVMLTPLLCLITLK